jgi:hypothetical protein
VGAACESDDAIATGLSSNATMITILMVLLLVTLLLTVFMGCLAYRIHTFREEQMSKMLGNSTGGRSSVDSGRGTEMTRSTLHQMRATAISNR